MLSMKSVRTADPELPGSVKYSFEIDVGEFDLARHELRSEIVTTAAARAEPGQAPQVPAQDRVASSDNGASGREVARDREQDSCSSVPLLAGLPSSHRVVGPSARHCEHVAETAPNLAVRAYLGTSHCRRMRARRDPWATLEAPL